MSKKRKESEVYFNLFNVENLLSDENSDTQENTEQESSENFVSIASMNDSFTSNSSDEIEHAPAQTTMFEYRNFFEPEEDLKEYTLEGKEVSQEKVESPIIEEYKEDAKTPVVEENNEEVEAPIIEEDTEDTEPIQEFFIEEISQSNTFEESEMVSMLENNPLDDQQTPPELFTEHNDSSILNDLSTFKEIKNKTPEEFETPYLYQGLKGDRVRYRLFLPSKRNAKLNRLKKNMFSWIITIISAILIAIILRSYVFVIATVNGPSMSPTLSDNEKLFVTKYTYKFSEFQRGDIVICKYDSPAYPDVYVKRVVALSGDTVSIVNGKLIVNDEIVEEDYILEPMAFDMDTVRVENGYVFVMGDNRNNSADSRKPTIGAIKEDLVIGKVQFRVFPLNKIGPLEEKK